MAYEAEALLANYSLHWVDVDANNSDGFLQYVDSEGNTQRGTDAAVTVRTEGGEIYVRIRVYGNEETLAGDYTDVAAAKTAAVNKLKQLGYLP